MIELRDIQARFGDFELRGVDLCVPAGGYCVLLGPPGSGKTSVVEVICGLRRFVSGRVVISGRQVDHLDPADRHIGYVPQDYALFTNMSVRENIAFGLRVRRLSRAYVAARVEQAADRMGISHLLARSCRGLSGGERQRVALARAVVLEPQVLLLDEPVSALDESTREQVCLELRGLHDALGMTTIHVSHNFEETRAVADMVAVLQGGRLAQVGSVDDIFRRPRNEFVAGFVRAGNILRGSAEPDGTGCRLTLAGRQFGCPAGLSGPVAMLLRPQDLRILAGDSPPAGRSVSLAGRVVAVHDPGACQVIVRVAVSDADTLAVAVARPDDEPVPYRAGQPVVVSFDPAKLVPLEPD